MFSGPGDGSPEISAMSQVSAAIGSQGYATLQNVTGGSVSSRTKLQWEIFPPEKGPSRR